MFGSPGQGEFKMTVADLGNTGLDEKAVIDHAIKIMSANGEVKVNYPHRIYGIYGRQLSRVGKDGSRSMVAMFNIMGRLYQIEAKVLPGGNKFELTRFQQSLVFERLEPHAGGVRAIREACPGRRDAPFAPGGRTTRAAPSNESALSGRRIAAPVTRTLEYQTARRSVDAAVRRRRNAYPGPWA